MFGKFTPRLIALTALVFAFAIFTNAQDLDSVTFIGKVIDPNGLPVVGATVTATRTETGEARTVTTNDDGLYKITSLKPGIYKLKASGSGFGEQETAEISTIAAQNIARDFKLAPAGVKAETSVTVTEDDVPAVDTTRTIVGGTVTQREIEELPVDSRNPLDLVLTLSGTAEEQLSTRDLADDRGQRGVSAPGTTPEEAGIFGLSGGAAYSNNVTIDGLDNNDDRGATFRFQPSIDSISEVQVITNQFSAEYGRASGGRVNLSTRGGTNKFRGRAYYYFKDESLNANTWNNNRRGIARAPFQDNNPGFTFGGPIAKNKLFFFTSYEYDNIDDSTVLDAWVPSTVSNPRFELPRPNNSAAGTVTIAGGASCPPPVGATCPANVVVGNYLEPTATPAKRHTFATRFDYNLNKSHSLTFSWQVGRFNDLRSFSGTNRISGSIIGRVRDTDAYNLTHNWIIGSRFVNQFRAQYSKLDPSAAQASGALSPAVLVTFTVPGDSGSSTMVFGSTTSSSDRAEDRWQFQDTLTFVRGNMTWRFGGDFHNVDTQFIDRFDQTGTYSFGNFSFFAGNSVSSLRQNFGGTSSLLNRYYGVFVQNDWRLRNNLTFSAGLRYERETVIKDNNNFGPRIALAWNPDPSSQKMVVRFGAGWFYNRVLLRTVDDYTGDSGTVRFDSTSLNNPNGLTIDFNNCVRPFLNSQFPNGVSLTTMVPISGTANGTTPCATNTQFASVAYLSRPSSVFRSLDPSLVIPESYQANVGFEREITKGLVFETNLTFNRTAHLWRETNPNAPILPAGTPDRNADGLINLTDYLLGITTGTNRFYIGSPSDTVGQHTTQSDAGAACTAGTNPCFVNINTPISTSTSSCSPLGTTVNSPVCRAFAAVATLRPFNSTLGPVALERVAPIGNSRYLGATFELRKRYQKWGHGFGGSLRFAYTVSRLMDDGIVNTSDPTVPGDFSREWSRSLADRTHRVAVTATIDTPRWMGKLRLSPLFRYGSSAPFNLSAGGIDRNLDGIANDRPNYVGSTDLIQWREFGSPFPTGVAQGFSLAPLGSPGNLPRNAGHGPAQYIFNLNVTREFKFKERFKIRPSFEFTNPLNATIYSFGSNFINFDYLNSTNATTVQTARDNFLAPTRTITPRRIRLGIRIDF